MDRPHVSIAIVGGGVTGLATAYYLEQAAKEEGWVLNGILLERERRLGGKLLTVEENGFLVEGGPDSFLTLKPWGLQLAREIGLEPQVVYPQAQGVSLLHRGRLHTVPRGMVGMVPSQPWAIWQASFLSWRGKLRASLEPFVRPRRNGTPESLDAFLSRRVGAEAADLLLEPFTAAIYAGDAHRMGLRPLFPTLIDWEEKHGSLTAGIRAARARARDSPQGHVFCSLRDGTGSLTRAIAARLGSFSVLTNNSVTSLALAGDGKRPGFRLDIQGGAPIQADCVVLAIPAHDAASLVRPVAPQVTPLLERLPAASTASVHLAFRRQAIAHPLNGTGFLVPRTEPSSITGCTWASSKWPGRAPQDWALLRAFTGWAGDASFMQKNDTTLIREATETLRPLLGLRGHPDHAWVHRWPGAMPQYGVGHLDWLDSLDRALASRPGLFLTGASYSGIGIPDCIRQAKEAAQRVRQFLSQPSAVLAGASALLPRESSSAPTTRRH